jgi:DNA-binding GntR family transcriptional regulator
VEINRDSAQPIQAQLVDDLRRRITEGEFAPGDKLPPLRALTAHYGVAEMTVHAAIRELQRDGLVVSSRGRGTYVTDDTAEQPAADETDGIEELRAEVADLRARVERIESREEQPES